MEYLAPVIDHGAPIIRPFCHEYKNKPRTAGSSLSFSKLGEHLVYKVSSFPTTYRRPFFAVVFIVLCFSPRERQARDSRREKAHTRKRSIRFSMRSTVRKMARESRAIKRRLSRSFSTFVVFRTC